MTRVTTILRFFISLVQDTSIQKNIPKKFSDRFL